MNVSLSKHRTLCNFNIKPVMGGGGGIFLECVQFSAVEFVC